MVAVQNALALLGFKSVIDMDDVMKKAGKDASLREDLRIRERSSVLVMDIKGVAEKPSASVAFRRISNTIGSAKQACASETKVEINVFRTRGERVRVRPIQRFVSSSFAIHFRQAFAPPAADCRSASCAAS